MKHFLLKFNHGVEIGAYLAYIGHYQRVNKEYLIDIIHDELEHRENLRQILEELEEQPDIFINVLFTCIGTVIKFLCAYCPIWSLNMIAKIMECFAVCSYIYLAKLYPQYSDRFIEMANAEDRHAEIFRNKNA